MTKDAMNDIATRMEHPKERKIKVNEKLSLSSALPSPITPVHSDNSSTVRISLPQKGLTKEIIEALKIIDSKSCLPEGKVCHNG